MRTAAISALGFLLAAGSAWAQSSDQDRDRSDSGGYSSPGYDSDRGSDRSSSDRASDRSWRHSWRSGDSSRDRSHDWAGSESRGHMSGFHGATYSGKGRSGASFYLKSGDKEFRVRCGDDDSTGECVDAALQMFREVTSHTAGASASPGAAGMGAAPGAAPSGGSATDR